MKFNRQLVSKYGGGLRAAAPTNGRRGRPRKPRKDLLTADADGRIYERMTPAEKAALAVQIRSDAIQLAVSHPQRNGSQTLCICGLCVIAAHQSCPGSAYCSCVCNTLPVRIA